MQCSRHHGFVWQYQDVSCFILWHCQTGRTVGLNKMVLQGVNELAPIPGCYFQCRLLPGMFPCTRVLLFWSTQPRDRPAWELSRFLGIVFWNQQKTFLYFSHVKLGGAVISCYTRGWSGEKSSCKYVKQKHDLSCHFACPCCRGLRGISLGGREQLASSSLSPASQTHHCSRCNSKANCHLPPCFFS